jgi:cytochrome c-type biogenesis protein CcmH/NrfF
MGFLETHAEYVVLWVTLVVWFGIAASLLWMERRLRRVEQQMERTREQRRFSSGGE